MIIEDLCSENEHVKLDMQMRLFSCQADFMSSKLWNVHDLWSRGRYEKWRDCTLVAELKDKYPPRYHSPDREPERDANLQLVES